MKCIERKYRSWCRIELDCFRLILALVCIKGSLYDHFGKRLILSTMDLVFRKRLSTKKE